MKAKKSTQLLKYIILFAVTVVLFYPIFLMIISSFKSKLEIFTSPLSLPENFSFKNYAIVWDTVNFSGYLWNSVIVSFFSVSIVIFVSSLAGFYLARYSFKWNPFVLFFFMIGLMLPMKLAIIPLYLIMMDFGLLDSLLSLIVVYVAGGIPFAVFLFYGFFRTLPKDLDNLLALMGVATFRCTIRLFYHL